MEQLILLYWSLKVASAVLGLAATSFWLVTKVLNVISTIHEVLRKFKKDDE